MFTVYITHSASPSELAQVYVLAQEAAMQGLEPIVAHRLWNPQDGVPPDPERAIQRADAVLLFAADNGHFLEWVNREMETTRNAPIVALVERGIQPQGITNENVVVFDRRNITPAVAAATERLKDLKLQQANRNLLAGLAIGGLALLALGLGGKGGRR